MTKDPKTTKEELIAKLALIDGQKKFLEQNDETLRKEFSKALNAPSHKTSRYGDEYEQTTYSWFEIFRELGKILSVQMYANFRDDLDSTRKDLLNFREDFLNSLPEEERMKIHRFRP